MSEESGGFWSEILEALQQSWANFVKDLGIMAEIQVEGIKDLFSKKEPPKPYKRVPAAWLRALKRYLDSLYDEVIEEDEKALLIRRCATIEVWPLLKKYYEENTDSKGRSRFKDGAPRIEDVIKGLFAKAQQQCAEHLRDQLTGMDGNLD